MRASLGIFVGGRSSRMGGFPKGLIVHRGERLVERLVRLAREAGLDPLLVGEAAPYAGYVADVPRVDDVPTNIGPLGGLGGLMQELLQSGRPAALAVACDMPAVDAAALRALLALPAAPIWAARRAGRWEPFLARYSVSAADAVARYVADGGRSFQPLLGKLATPLPAGFDPATLEDWDAPVDLPDDTVRR